MSAPTTTKLMTAEEFYEFVYRPENKGRSFELVRGEVIEIMSRPGDRHCVVCGNVAFVLGLYVRQSKRGRMLCNDPGVILDRDPDTVRGPDVAYFATSQKYEELNPKWIEETPTLAVEVQSPNERPGQLIRKVAEYQHAEVPLVWVIYPEERTVAVHRRGANIEVLDHTQHLEGGDILPGFRCAVVDFFYSAGDQVA